jgi:NAD(P)-dependent dehydrogenase (short-subunit alcohol dehydrogenase family)
MGPTEQIDTEDSTTSATAGALEGKVAVVTGAGRGIGRCTALYLAAQGARVVVNDPGVSPDGTGQDQAPADQVVGEIVAAGGEAVASHDSVASMEGGTHIVSAALDAWGRIDILFNNAGILRDRMFIKMNEEDWDAVIAVHLKGAFACTKAAAPHMQRQRCGRIINASSSSGLMGNAAQANYGAAKSAIAGFTRVLARELGRYAITCNAIAPMAATRLTVGMADMAAKYGLVIPEPEYVAPLVAYLASDAAWNVNGQIFYVFGGSVCLSQPPVARRTIFKEGGWSVNELIEAVPTQLTQFIENPGPPADHLRPAFARSAPAEATTATADEQEAG